MYQKYQLPNKANIYFVPLKDTKSVTTLVMYPVGSRYETEKLAGASHFIEHLMFKGTKKRKNTLALTREIDRLGAEYNAFTSKESTGYYIKTDAEFVEISFDILSDMLFNSVFDPKEMEREKTVIVEEIRMYKDNPLINIENVFEDLLFAGCPLGRDIAGTEKHVRSYKRPWVLEYRDKHYSPAQMTIVIAGAIDDKIERLAQEYFGSEKNKKISRPSYKPSVFGPSDKAGRLVIEKKKTDQAQLMLGFPGFKYIDKRNPALAVLNTVLGGSMSSRLFIQIRERRGLAYVVRSGSENFRDAGYVYVRIGLEAKNINKAIQVVKNEIQKILEAGVSKKELRDAKTHIRGSAILALEDSSTQASFYAKQALFDEAIKTPEERLLEIDAVTNEEIIRVAQEIFKWEKIRVAVIGNVNVEDIRF